MPSDRYFSTNVQIKSEFDVYLFRIEKELISYFCIGCMPRYVGPAKPTKYDPSCHPEPVSKSNDAEWDSFPQRVCGFDGWWRRICGHCHRFPQSEIKTWWRSSKPFGSENVSTPLQPSLCKEWHYDRNGSVLLPMRGEQGLYWWGGLQPEHVSRGQHVRVWWYCPKGHSYDASVHSRAIRLSKCPICAMKGPEKQCFDWLKNMNVKFHYNYASPQLKSKCDRALRFDFWLPKHNLVIELDGPHHRRPIAFGHSERDPNTRFIRQVENDKIKNDYCKIHGIKIIRIALERNDTFVFPSSVKSILQRSSHSLQ